MRDINRIHEICAELEKAWLKSPDQRLGQLLENYIFPIKIIDHQTVCLPFFQEDDITLKKLKDLFTDRK
jgi:hypothetical protein